MTVEAFTVAVPIRFSVGTVIVEHFPKWLSAYETDQNLSMYADDHQLYEINENVSTVNHNLSANATKASVWYKSNLLKGNLSKYHTMLITNKHVAHEFGVRVQGTDVECLIGFDNKLNFSEHINITCKKASQRIGVLMRLKNLVHGCETSWNYNFSKLQYFLTLPTVILLGISAERVRKLERIQERGLRAVFRDGQSTYEKLLNKAKLTTLYERRLQDIAVWCTKWSMACALRASGICSKWIALATTLEGMIFTYPGFIR